jgi:hypothetical protein
MLTYKQIDWLKHNNIENYYVNNDDSVDVNKAVNLYWNWSFDLDINIIPVKFNIIKGNFNCKHRNLTTLENCPRIVEGDFYCSSNPLTTLEYFPEIVKGVIFINHVHNITNFDGLLNCQCNAYQIESDMPIIKKIINFKKKLQS